MIRSWGVIANFVAVCVEKMKLYPEGLASDQPGMAGKGVMSIRSKHKTEEPRAEAPCLGAAAGSKDTVNMSDVNVIMCPRNKLVCWL